MGVKLFVVLLGVAWAPGVRVYPQINPSRFEESHKPVLNRVVSAIEDEEVKESNISELVVVDLDSFTECEGRGNEIQLGSGFGSISVIQKESHSLLFTGSRDAIRTSVNKSYHEEQFDIETSDSLVVGIFEVEKMVPDEKKLFAVLKGFTPLSASLQKYTRNMSNHHDDVKTQELVLDFFLKSQMAAGPVELSLDSNGLFVGVEIKRNKIQSLTVGVSLDRLNHLIRPKLMGYRSPRTVPSSLLVYRSESLLSYVTVFQPLSVKEGAQAIAALDDLSSIRRKMSTNPEALGSLSYFSDVELFDLLFNFRKARAVASEPKILFQGKKTAPSFAHIVAARVVEELEDKHADKISSKDILEVYFNFIVNALIT